MFRICVGSEEAGNAHRLLHLLPLSTGALSVLSPKERKWVFREKLHLPSENSVTLWWEILSGFLGVGLHIFGEFIIMGVFPLGFLLLTNPFPEDVHVCVHMQG